MNHHSIDQNFIDDIIAKIDIVNLIEDYIPLKKQGNNYSANCPFHAENTPSFTVSAQKQFFYCFGCKASGNAITFLMKYENIEFLDALEKLASTLGMNIPKKSYNSSNINNLYDITKTACLYYEEHLRKNKHAIDYLKGRNITGITAKFFKIGYAPQGWHNLLNTLTQKKYSLVDIEKTGLIKANPSKKPFDFFRDRIIFPIRNYRGQLVGFGGRTLQNTENAKYLNSSESSIFQKSKLLYGLYEALQSNKNLEQLIIVEGYLDVIALHQNGLKNTIAILGTAIKKEHINLITRYTKNFIFCFDGDLAGKKAAEKAMSTCLPLLEDEMEIKFVFLPPGEDPDSIINKKGIGEFKDIIKLAIPIDQLLFKIMTNKLNLSEAAHKSKLIKQSIPIINNIPGKARAHLMYNHLSSLVHVNIDELKSFKEEPTQTNNSKVSFKEHTKKLSTIEILTALLIQHPNLQEFIKPEHFASIKKYPNNQPLIKLIEIINQSPKINTAIIIEK
ncbi:MAG: DNA primase, partial [Legionellales bacterium]|nr:DNA primase [Legionellales bacterium]